MDRTLGFSKCALDNLWIKIIKMKRIAFYPKDIIIITGKSEWYSRELHRIIKNQLNKEKHQIVSFDEFWFYMGLKTEELEKKFKAWNLADFDRFYITIYYL